MRRVLLALTLPLVCVSYSQAQLASPFDLVRGLREAGLTDLAYERLNELKAKPGTLSPDEIKTIPLEMARVRLEQAIQETEDGKRAGLLAQAQKEFDDFIKANPTHPKTSQANMEIARLISVNAKGLLSKGRRVEGKEARAAEFSKVRPEFDKAIARYQGAITAIDARLKGMDGKSPLAIELTQSKLHATLDSAILTYEKAKTFVGAGETAKQSEEILKAQKAFTKLADLYPTESAGYLAAVWQTQCDFEITDPAKASKTMQAFILANRTNREAADAVRQAQYFVIEHTEQADTKDPIAQKLRVENVALEWLKRYPEYRNSREGLRARFLYVGLGRQDRAKPGIKYDPKTGRAASLTAESRALLESANKVFADLAETDNEYSDRASVYRLRNMVTLLDAAGAGKEIPITAIRTLEQGYLAAQVQQARILQVKDKEKDKPEPGAKINLEDPDGKDPKMPKEGMKGKDPAPPAKKEAPPAPKEAPKAVVDPKAPKQLTEAERVNLAIAYLERGLSMATSKDSARDVLNAQLLLALFFREANRYDEAAVLCDGLAHNNSKMSKGAFAAQLGVDSYNTSLGKLKESVNKTEEAIEADLLRLKALGDYADKNWPNEPPTDGVRQTLAFYLNQEKNYEGAWTMLSRITNAYPGVYQARWAQAIAMFYMVNPTTRDSKLYREELQKNITTHSAQWVQTISQLEALPEAPPTIEPQKGTFYVLARTMLAQLYFMSSDYVKCEATVKATVVSAGKLANLEADKKADLISDVRVQYFRALAGRAADIIKAKEFGKVIETLDPEITALAKELKEPAPMTETAAHVRLRQAQRNLIISAMTACVQDKKVDKAGELLGILQSGGGNIESNIAVMQQLVSAIRGQIDGLKKENKDTEAKELSDSFTQFLDKIGSTPNLPNSIIKFLGHGYDSVGQPVKAFTLYSETLAKPFVNTGKTPAEQDEQAKADQVFRRSLQFEQVRALRQAGGENNLKTASGMMKDIVGDPGAAKGPVKGWGYSNVNIRKEYIYLLEDQKIYGGPNGAISQWTRLSKEFVPTIPGPPKEGDKDGATKAAKRQLFFELNYEAQRSSAKAYATADLAKIKKDQAFIDGKLGDIGQKLHDLLESNKDISADLREKILALAAQYPATKKKFDELSKMSQK
ncbi:hypothetical protein [Zavarzinella formosa]|uniref:hypothetical protein n=1 Tax=Zavarzinella formosa TaxID=360055 RepID=UPI0002E74952|nr:hypothetical protein [Zavarzinella formosa]